MNKKKRLAIYYVLVIIMILITLFFAMKYIDNMYKEKVTYNNLKEIEEKENNDTSDSDDYENKYLKYQDYYNNKDIIGTLKVSNIIDTKIVQTTDNKYYLTHLINKKYGIVGSVFVDYNSDIENGRQINIYGHNSKKYDIPFKYLVNYLDKDFFLNNKNITLETKTGIRNYEIFSVKVVTDNIEHTKVLFDSDASFNDHITRLRANSLYDSNLVVTSNDQVLVLQTCLFNNSLGSYLIISARKI